MSDGPISTRVSPKLKKTLKMIATVRNLTLSDLVREYAHQGSQLDMELLDHRAAVRQAELELEESWDRALKELETEAKKRMREAMAPHKQIIALVNEDERETARRYFWTLSPHVRANVMKRLAKVDAELVKGLREPPTESYFEK